MKNVNGNLVLIVVSCLMICATSVTAGENVTVSPQMMDLTLDRDETLRELVSFTFHPLCIRPFDVDVIASQPDARVTNVTGAMLNGCGGDTSTFTIELIGTGEPQQFKLLFVDAEFGDQLGSIPVTINNTKARAEPLMGLVFRRNAIKFQVSSGGCTTKDDFQVEVLESFPLQLRLVRVREDPCDAILPLGTRIRFSYREIGIERGAKVRVVNPLATVTVPPRRPR